MHDTPELCLVERGGNWNLGTGMEVCFQLVNDWWLGPLSSAPRLVLVPCPPAALAYV